MSDIPSSWNIIIPQLAGSRELVRATFQDKDTSWAKSMLGGTVVIDASENETVTNEFADELANLLRLVRPSTVAVRGASPAFAREFSHAAQIHNLAVTFNDAETDERIKAVADAILGEVGTLIRESNHVADWPADEQELYRNGDWRSFTDRRDQLSRMIAEKAAVAALAAIADRSS
ncbi:hypothetical protein [Leifsonia sp. Leaf264]|uniref:hypothetical protein n=1 Tax=Leifsonia sp. Leaf264 TaxID=1736314 RepID=UPI0006FD7C52|nr:hypothetical protein [Leifsonia sp. Leaf264]KQO98406.1 hypothetical protein ASF30_10115 [Leifsonia sp. Leaf264]